MGATTFQVSGVGKDAREVFAELVRRAQYDYGHAGYTGTIAEKRSFVKVDPPPGIAAGVFMKWAHGYPEGGHPPEHEALVLRAHRIWDDKWGPALCVELHGYEARQFLLAHHPKDTRVFVFSGWASE